MTTTSLYGRLRAADSWLQQDDSWLQQEWKWAQVTRMSRTTIKNMQDIIRMSSHWKHVVLVVTE
jgi:hypothetical protein